MTTLASWFPLWGFVAIRDFLSNLKQKLNVFHCAEEIPGWINFVGRLVVMFRDVFVAFLLTLRRRAAQGARERRGDIGGDDLFGRFMG